MSHVEDEEEAGEVYADVEVEAQRRHGGGRRKTDLWSVKLKEDDTSAISRVEYPGAQSRDLPPTRLFPVNPHHGQQAAAN